MTKAWIAIDDFGRCEQGTSIVEYAMLLSLIAILCLGAVSLLGTKLSDFMSTLSTTV